MCVLFKKSPLIFKEMAPKCSRFSLVRVQCEFMKNRMAYLFPDPSTHSEFPAFAFSEELCIPGALGKRCGFMGFLDEWVRFPPPLESRSIWMQILLKNDFASFSDIKVEEIVGFH